MHKSKMRIWSFIKPSPNSIIPSVKIANFVSDITGAQIVHDDTWDYDKPLKVLFIVNGAFAFCKYLHILAKAVLKAERIVWIQNDYTIIPPKVTGAATSPFRKAFRIRHKRMLPPMEMWTTVQANAGEYVNWNALTWNPLPEFRVRELRRKAARDLFYYGSFRNDRVKVFDQYFEQADYPITISSASKKFADRYRHATHIPPIRENFLEELTVHGVGLYVEDAKSTREFHSPANRLYEMLSAGLPMVFQQTSVKQLREAGFSVQKYVVHAPSDIGPAIWYREEIWQDQRKEWFHDYVGDLRKRVIELVDGL